MTNPSARYEYRAELVDLVRALEQRAADLDARGYDVSCEHTTHHASGDVTETLTVHWRARP